MDIRFLAIIFLVAALMEMLAKMMRKAKQREIADEGEAAPRTVDPLAEVFKELKLVAEDEEAPQPARRELERGAGGSSARREEAGPGAEEPRGEPSEVWAMPASPPRESPAGGFSVPLAPSGRVAEPSRPQGGRLFEPVGPDESPVAPVPVPASPKMMKTVPHRERVPRPVEVRSREFRPREAREIVTHRRTEARPASAESGPVSAERVAGREVERVRDGTGGHGVLSLGSVQGLRRLVVAREVLGPPLALRDKEPF